VNFVGVDVFNNIHKWVKIEKIVEDTLDFFKEHAGCMTEEAFRNHMVMVLSRVRKSINAEVYRKRTEFYECEEVFRLQNVIFEKVIAFKDGKLIEL